MNGLQLTRATQQMLARMQPGMQNQFLQGLKLGHHLLQGLGNGFGSVDNGTRNPMPSALASECNRIIMLYIQEQRKRPLVSVKGEAGKKVDNFISLMLIFCSCSFISLTSRLIYFNRIKR